ncbi:MAG TPA: hypothetical protein PLN86_15925, partial [Candidatus Hydrogenedentes bacterium]|nr:hypothetical protein [Candidatus Hydrogenedentota bacterium]
MFPPAGGLRLSSFPGTEETRADSPDGLAEESRAESAAASTLQDQEICEGWPLLVTSNGTTDVADGTTDVADDVADGTADDAADGVEDPPNT